MEQVAATEKECFVEASIGDETIIFELQRSELQTFEMMTNAPAFFLLKRLASGLWSLKELHAVLRFAHPDGFIRSERQVDDLLDRWGPGNFVTLASRILEAALFGLDSDDATWTMEAAARLAAEGEI